MNLYIVEGLREIVYELFFSKLKPKSRIFRLLFRFQSIRKLMRLVHDKKHKVAKIDNDLFNKGYQILQVNIPEKILEILFSQPFYEDGSNKKFNSLGEVLNYEGKRLHARYTVLNPHKSNIEILSFAYENPAYKVIQSYLGKNVKVQYSVCWVSMPNVLKEDNFEFGFHMDISSRKWVNLFIYLNDVDESNGPHSCISGTHEKRHWSSFLERRLTYSRAIKKYKQEDIKIFTGKKGTAILEDTGNYHRAMPINGNHRVMLQFTYSNYEELHG